MANRGPKQAAQQSILLVEDDSMIRRLVSDLLHDEGYCVQVAATGSEAISRVSEQAFDAIILDLYLPGISGFEVCVHIRTHISKHVPILVVTAQDGIQGVSDLLRAGANDYLRKPFDLEVLLRRLQWLIAQAPTNLTGRKS